jgi:hypothetical protein
VSPVKYEIGFYIPEDEIHHSYSCENLRSYVKRDVSRNDGAVVATAVWEESATNL